MGWSRVGGAVSCSVDRLGVFCGGWVSVLVGAPRDDWRLVGEGFFYFWRAGSWLVM